MSRPPQPTPPPPSPQRPEVRPIPHREAPPRLRVRRPVDFLAVIPYLLGFHPAESLVVVLSRRGRVVLTARLDLPAVAAIDMVRDQVQQLIEQHDIDGLVLVGYSDDVDVAREVLGEVQQRMGPDTDVREVLLVSRARWWSLTCTSGCCPADGGVFDPEAHPLAAEAVYAGLSAERSRTSLEQLVAGPSPGDLSRLRARVAAARAAAVGHDRAASAALVAQTVRRWLGCAGGPDEEACAALQVAALDLTVRDVAWAMMSRDGAVDHVQLWTRVVACAPSEVASAPLGMLGAAAWISGNGALLNCCVERLEATDPGYTLGRLLADLSDRALPPSVWDELCADLRDEVAAATGVAGLH